MWSKDSNERTIPDSRRLASWHTSTRRFLSRLVLSTVCLEERPATLLGSVLLPPHPYDLFEFTPVRERKRECLHV